MRTRKFAFKINWPLGWILFVFFYVLNCYCVIKFSYKFIFSKLISRVVILTLCQRELMNYGLSWKSPWLKDQCYKVDTVQVFLCKPRMKPHMNLKYGFLRSYFIMNAPLFSWPFQVIKIWMGNMEYIDKINNIARYTLINTKYRQMAFRLARWHCSCVLFGNPWSNKSEWWPPEGDNSWNLLFSSRIR